MQNGESGSFEKNWDYCVFKVEFVNKVSTFIETKPSYLEMKYV